MSIQTLVLTPGKCAILPKGATITSVLVDGDGQATSTCGTLPTPSQYVCWKFRWEVSTGSAPLDDAIFDSLIVGDNIYPVPLTYSNYSAAFTGPFSGYSLEKWITTDPILTGVVLYGCSATNGINRLLKIKIPPGIAAPQLKVKNPTGLGDYTTLYLVAESDSDCSTCTL
jgi:hypothetical protein